MKFVSSLLAVAVASSLAGGFVGAAVVLRDRTGAEPPPVARRAAVDAAGSLPCARGEPAAGRFYLRGEEAPFLSGPGPEHPPVLVRAGERPRTLEATMVLEGLCLDGAWLQARIVERAGRPMDGETGWVEAALVTADPGGSPDERLLWQIEAEAGLSRSEKAEVRRMALNVLQRHPSCRTITAGSRDPEGGGYTVTCVAGNGSATFRMALDAGGGARIRRAPSPDPYPESLSYQLCERAIRAHAVTAATHRAFALLDRQASLEGAERTIVQTFRSADPSGRPVIREARCRIAPDGGVDIAILGAD